MIVSFMPALVRETACRRKFLENQEENLFMGSFESFAAAEAGAPPSKAVGYDNAPLGDHRGPAGEAARIMLNTTATDPAVGTLGSNPPRARMIVSCPYRHAVTRTQRPVDGTRPAFKMNNRYQPGGARREFGGISTLITPAPTPLTTHSRPRCDMLKPCVTVPERSRTTSVTSAALGVLMLNVVP